MCHRLGSPRRVVASAAFVVTAGSLLHFAWEWSGRNPVVAVFAAVNESTWEHLKLAFWPALLLAPVQRSLYGRPPGWLVATALRALLPPFAIVCTFYGYTALLGTHLLVLDIATFVVAVVIGEVVGHRVMPREHGSAVRSTAGGALILATAAFATLSFQPPAFFLFEDPAEERRPSSTAVMMGSSVEPDGSNQADAGASELQLTRELLEERQLSCVHSGSGLLQREPRCPVDLGE